MATKPKLTHAEHQELGLVLASVHKELVHRRVQLENSYPKNNLPARRLGTAIKALQEARSVLDDWVFGEYPVEASVRDYYPRDIDRLSITPKPADAPSA